LALLQGFLEIFRRFILGGFQGFELLLKQADIGGLACDFFPASEAGADKPNQKGQDKYNQNNYQDSQNRFHPFVLKKLL